MTLNTNGKIARFYYWNYGNLPDNFCAFFWKLLFALLLFPITWAGFPYKDAQKFGERFGAGVIGWVVLGVTAAAIIAAIQDPTGALNVVGFALATLLGLILIIAFVVFIQWLQSSESPESVQIIKTKIASVKENYCPRINWTRE